MNQSKVNKKLLDRQNLLTTLGMKNTQTCTDSPLQNEYNSNDIKLGKSSGFYIDRKTGMTVMALKRNK